VILLEKSRHLGGLVPLAALIKGSEPEELSPWVAYLRGELHRLGVKVKLGVEADATAVLALEPDAVIVATGRTLVVPPVPTDANAGRGPKIVTAPKLHSQVKPLLGLVGPVLLERLTHIWLPMGKRVTVIGGSFHGCEIAEFLAKRGRTVTIVEPSPVIGTGVIDSRLGPLLEWFGKKGVAVFSGASDIQVTGKGVRFTLPDGTNGEIQADTVVPTAPIAADRRLVEQLQGKAGQVFAVGDCR
jgi:2,4-dienoyl-CoA reductase (NADPH2)